MGGVITRGRRRRRSSCRSSPAVAAPRPVVGNVTVGLHESLLKAHRDALTPQEVALQFGAAANQQRELIFVRVRGRLMPKETLVRVFTRPCARWHGCAVARAAACDAA